MRSDQYSRHHRRQIAGLFFLLSLFTVASAFLGSPAGTRPRLLLSKIAKGRFPESSLHGGADLTIRVTASGYRTASHQVLFIAFFLDVSLGFSTPFR